MPLPDQKFSVDLTSAPSDLAQLYSSEYAKACQSGMSEAEADKFAARQLALSGWFCSDSGWEQLKPDTRKKINLRHACKQPDGTYLVKDVDVFYANNIKRGPDGSPLEFSRADIGEYIKNTNEFIGTGSPPPCLTKGHPLPGSNAHSFGHAMNWRQLPGKDGMARVDMASIPESLVNEWREGKWVGISAGIPSLKEKRFNHVALLGSMPQALPKLPQTVVFGSDEMIAFSAEPPSEEPTPEPIQTKGRIMKLSQANIDKLTTALAETFSAIEFEGQGPTEETLLPEKPKLQDHNELPAAKMELEPNGGSSKGGNYSAEMTALEQKYEAIQQELQAARVERNGLAGRLVRQDWDGWVKEQKSAGLQFDVESANEIFTEAASKGNKGAVEALKKMILRSPKDARVAVGTVFASNSNQPINATANAAGVQSALEGMGFSYDAKDLEVGQMFGNEFH